jgi:CheY-like chemotaxis protein
MEKVDFSLDDVLENLANMVSVKANEKKLQVLFSVSKEAPHSLIGDPLRVGQILINLCNNAVKFTETGEIVVTVKRLNEGPDSVELQFSVRDSGIGLTKEQIGKLFQAFSQADSSTTRKFGGTGLGLTISKRLVEMMDGKIWVESEPGKWSEFIFTAKFGKSSTGKKKHRILSEDMKGMPVLVVDDNEVARNVFQDALESFGTKARTASSGSEALDLLEKADPDNPYKLVLMDWKMPEMDGIEASKRIHKSSKILHKPHIILVTAYGREEIMHLAEKEGLDAFLVKPVSNSLLFNTIMGVFGKDVSYLKDRRKSEVKKEEAQKRIRGARILVAEDNEINQQIAVELLEAVGLSVQVVDNGRKAVEAVKQTEFDLVLMDLQMPVLGGMEATREIREDDTFKDLPVIAMTANVMKDDIDKCLKAGLNDHVAKPIDTERLYETLLKWIKHKDREIPDYDSTQESIRIEEKSNDEDQLPNLPGIDIESGLARVGGNKKLYRKLLIKLRTDYSNSTEEIKEAIKNNNLDDAERFAHTVKGVAGNIGVNNLQKTAADLEAGIRERKTDEYENLLNKFSGELGRVITTLQDLKSEEDGNKKKEAKDTESKSPEELVELLVKLAEQIKTRKPKKCAPVIEMISGISWPEQFNNSIKEIIKLIGKYKFKDAGTITESIISKLNKKN